MWQNASHEHRACNMRLESPSVRASTISLYLYAGNVVVAINRLAKLAEAAERPSLNALCFCGCACLVEDP